jgi:hypothetical protein
VLRSPGSFRWQRSSIRERQADISVWRDELNSLTEVFPQPDLANGVASAPTNMIQDTVDRST